MDIKNLTEEELAWFRAIFLAGFEAGGRDARTHSNDVWVGNYGARSELEFQRWLESADRRMVSVA